MAYCLPVLHSIEFRQNMLLLDLGLCLALGLIRREVHCILGKVILKHLLDLGHQFCVGVAGRLICVFLNCTSGIEIHEITIREIRRSEIGAGKVIETLQQLLLMLYGSTKSQIMLPHVWRPSSHLLHSGFDYNLQQLHITV